MVLETFVKTYTKQVSSAWLYILILTVLFSGLIKYLSSRGLTRNYKSSRHGFFNGGILALSLAGILALTLCGREWDGRPGSRFQLIPFWSYWRTFFQGDEGLGIQIVNNILLFIPFGFSLPLNFPGFRRVRNTVLASGLLSLTVELIQGFTGLGLCEIDDMIGNTLGGGIGVWIWNCCAGKKKRQERKRKH